MPDEISIVQVTTQEPVIITQESQNVIAVGYQVIQGAEGPPGPVGASGSQGPSGSSDWNFITNIPTGIVSASAQYTTGSYTGSFIGSASYAQTSSFALSSSWSSGNISSSYAATASWSPGSVSSSYAVTASFGEYAFTASYISGGQFTAGGTAIPTTATSWSYATTSSHALQANSSVSSSYALTSSFAALASNAVSSSHALKADNSVSSSYSLTSSFAAQAMTSSYAVTASFSGIQFSTFTMNIEQTGVLLFTGYRGMMRVPYNCTVTTASLFSRTSGSVNIDLRTMTYEQWSAGVNSGSSIVGTALSMSANGKYQDSTLSGWSTQLTKGNALNYIVSDVSGSATFDQVSIVLEVRKN